MAKTVLKCILLLNILISLTQAAVQQINNQPGYTQNSLDDARFAPRSSSVSSVPSKDKTKFEYDHVNDLDNRVLEQFDHRYPDGSYEFRYELADGQARYERGYFIKINHQKSLVVVGYYSYRMPNGQFLTVFYNADRHGYRQNQSITRDTLPDLPRSIEVPQFKEDSEDDVSTTTTKSNYNNAHTTTNRNHF